MRVHRPAQDSSEIPKEYRYQTTETSHNEEKLTGSEKAKLAQPLIDTLLRDGETELYSKMQVVFTAEFVSHMRNNTHWDYSMQQIISHPTFPNSQPPQVYRAALWNALRIIELRFEKNGWPTTQGS